MGYCKQNKKRFKLSRKISFSKWENNKNDILQQNLEIYRRDLIIRSKWWFKFVGEEKLKSQLYIYPLSVREGHHTKLILAPWFTVGIATVTLYDLPLQISQKLVAGDTIDGMHFHFSKNSFILPGVS